MGTDTSRRTWQRHATSVVLLVSMALLMGSCGGTTTPPAGSAAASDPRPSSHPETSASPRASGGPGDLAWIFEAPADPIDVVVTLDVAKKVEAAIPVEGGTVSATGADGTVYTLDIPKDALLTETTIGLTPVTSLDGMPFGSEPTYAVQLSPDGLYLYSTAVLTITPAQVIPVGEQLMFGYREDGKDLTLAPPVVDSSEIKVQVFHFSGNGVTRGTLADIEPLRSELGGDVGTRLEGAVARELGRNREAQLNGRPSEFPDFEPAFRAFEEQVVRPRVAAGLESCAAGRLAIQTVLQLERQRQLIGMSAGEPPFEPYPELVSKAARQCVLEEFELCVEDHVIHRMAAVWRGYERQNGIAPYLRMPLVEDGVLREARELTIKCLTFKATFESTATVTIRGGGYESKVKSDVTLRFEPDEDKLRGKAQLINEAFKWRAPCGAISVRGGTTFDIGNLIIESSVPEALLPDDLVLGYTPGNTTESAKIKICGSSAAPLPISEADAAWTKAHLAAHKGDLDTRNRTGSRFIVEDWEIFGDEYFAKKEWIKEAGPIVEAGTFKLYHTPGA